MDDTDDLKAHKKKYVREIDSLFRLNGYIQSQVQGTSQYRNASCWCDCGRGLKGEHDICSKCESEKK